MHMGDVLRMNARRTPEKVALVEPRQGTQARSRRAHGNTAVLFWYTSGHGSRQATAPEVAPVAASGSCSGPWVG